MHNIKNTWRKCFKETFQVDDLVSRFNNIQECKTCKTFLAQYFSGDIPFGVSVLADRAVRFVRTSREIR